MDNKKEQKQRKNDEDKNLLGRRHDEPNADHKKQGAMHKKDAHHSANQEKENNPEKKTGIDDDSSGTERKIPRMNH